jgi:colanic acid biosynthesis glycosyl transferase WcaI
MASGSPIITNVRGELQVVLEPLGAAEMIEPDSLVALVDMIEKLAKDPARRKLLSEGGVEGAKRFDRAALADKMLAALQSVSKQNHGQST